MTVAAPGEFAPQEDPFYREGMAHLQAGEWQKAIECFEGLARKYPDDPAVQRTLEEARFKAKFDSTSKLRPKRVTFNWRPWLLRLVVVVVVGLVVYQAVRAVNGLVATDLPMRQLEARIERTYQDVEDNIAAERFDEAEAGLEAVSVLEQELLQLDVTASGGEMASASPPSEGEFITARAARYYVQIAEGRERLTLYESAKRLLDADELTGALQLLEQIEAASPGYRDVPDLIQDIVTQQGLEVLFLEGEEMAKAGRCPEAVAKLEELRERNISYKRRIAEGYLATCYLVLGQAIVDLDPPDMLQLPESLNYFEKALELKPTMQEADLARDLVNAFLQGRTLYEQGAAARAVPLLRSVFDQNPQYLHGIVVNYLYDALVQSGDEAVAAEDWGKAYDYFRQACQDLPVEDATLACSRFEVAMTMVTPTPTPTATPTATPTPLPTSTPLPPTPIPPTPTPAPVRLAYPGKILFRADNPQQPGWWVMDPDGSNRIYLGNARELRDQYQALRAAETEHLDEYKGLCRTYTTQTGDDDLPQVYVQCQEPPAGPPPTWKVSKGLAKTSYDPVWSPDGRRIAFVSQTKSSDDIWIADAYTGEDQWNLTPNDWEWDKHPSWGPDSRFLVFWSNREGTKQIFIIDADDQRMWSKISNTTWDEYDPVWIK